ncbi:hypothetical protein [Parabacteroides goldsteinii]|nr:hypothetical protein [Parabacteroides goldsteinii]
MRKIVVLQIVAFYLFSCLVTYAQSQRYKGYPKKDTDIFSEFANPPKGYGNVPFYWWNGDSLNKERMKEQLDILSASATDGFAVSYIHMDPEVDVGEMKDGYGLSGKTEAGKPKVFSGDWWNFWNWFAKECSRKNIGLGMDDYTIGWIGNGYYTDELLKEEKFQNYQGDLEIVSDSVRGGTTFIHDIPERLVGAVAWPGKIDLTEYISGGKLLWRAPEGKDYKVYILSTKKSHLLHPDIGREYVNVYFDRFEKNMGDAASGG